MPVIDDFVGMTMQRILFATDFSNVAENAAKYVEVLARRFASEVTIAHVLDLSAQRRIAQKMSGEEDVDTQAISAAALELERRVFEGNSVKAHAELLESKDAVESIVQLAEHSRADLIVCGTNARRGVERVVLGSFAEQLILTSKVPVMIIGPKAKKPEYSSMRLDKILFATDMEEGSARRAEFALNLAKDSRAKIYFCHVLKHERHEIAGMLERKRKFESDLRLLIPEADYEWCSPECVVGQGIASEYIVDAASELGADLIVLGTSSRSAWTTHFTIGNTGRILSDAPCAVLTVR